MKIPVAWLNTIQHKKRTGAALAGIVFSLLLIFMQLGFLGATKKNATVVYDVMDFDLLITSGQFLTLTKSGSFNRYRLIQANALDGVESATGVLIDVVDIHNAETDKDMRLIILGVDPQADAFQDESMSAAQALLTRNDSIAMDTRAMPGIGTLNTGTTRYVNETPLEVVGRYSMGIGLLASGTGMVSYDTYSKINNEGTITSFHLGLIRFKDRTNLAASISQLKGLLPKDVLIWTREEIETAEKKFYVEVKPVGIMFQIGAAVAFIVGAVILYQILSAEISNRLKEFATIKAIGYAPGFIYRIGIQQGILFSTISFFPALLLSYGLYTFINSLSGFHLIMSFRLASLVFILALLMCAIAAFFSLGKIAQADPADLF